VHLKYRAKAARAGWLLNLAPLFFARPHSLDLTMKLFTQTELHA
jgi:hypothetical protein